MKGQVGGIVRYVRRLNRPRRGVADEGWVAGGLVGQAGEGELGLGLFAGGDGGGLVADGDGGGEGAVGVAIAEAVAG